MIDLHVHSTYSDGSFTPEELIGLAAEAGLSAIALTDHDTVDGVGPFVAACRTVDSKRCPLPIPGVEISADVSKGTLHMLGYFLDTANENLRLVLERIRNGREIRNDEIIERLRSQGLDIGLEDVRAFAGDQVVGRPHIAQALQHKGYVKSFKQAFDKYLAKGKSAYADRFRLTAEDSIGAIRKAGGVPVLSHPFTLDLDESELRKYVRVLKDTGLAGVEVYYSEHSPKQIEQYLALARDLDLIATGGSDFHGTINPGIKLGRGFGSLRVQDDIVDTLRAAASRIQESKVSTG